MGIRFQIKIIQWFLILERDRGYPNNAWNSLKKIRQLQATIIMNPTQQEKLAKLFFWTSFFSNFEKANVLLDTN